MSAETTVFACAPLWPDSAEFDCSETDPATAAHLWQRGNVEILKRCDALVCVTGWENSRGATNEIQVAREFGIPVFETFEDFKGWHSQGDGLR